jgi:hypothetical protein
MDIAPGILPIPGRTPVWRRQDADLLIVANGFGGTLVARASWPMASSRSMAIPPSTVCGWKDTPSTDWKVKSKALSRIRSASLPTSVDEMLILVANA